MILTCPQCTTRYLLPATALAPDGRNVKCSNCGEVWFQIPDPDELAALMPQEDTEQDEQGFIEEGGDESESFEDFVEIPEGVRPDIELGDEHREEDEEGAAPAENWKSVAGSYAAAACVFFAILGVLLIAKSSVVSAWPASAALYQTLGMEIDVPGQGLVFDRVKIESQGLAEAGEELLISGQVINLTNKDQILPVIEASLRSEDGEELEKWFIEVPERKIPAEADLAFQQNYESQHRGAYDLSVRFVLKKPQIKTASKGDDNTPVQSSDGPVPPNDGGAN